MLFVLLVGFALFARAEDINFNRVHLVDAQYGNESSFTNSFLFRGNAPLVNKSKEFAYTEMMSYMRERATAANYSFPASNDDVYLIDITFENVFDGGFEVESEFWSNPSNSVKGHYEQWELLGAVLWANDLSTAEQDKMIRDGDIWKEDKLPSRVQLMRKMLLGGPPAGYKVLAVYVHCAGGCDRTGEFVGAYRMSFFHTPELRPIYAMDVSECGRAPDYFASGALGWYCLQWNLFNSTSGEPPMPDCLDAYTCKPFGSCNATGV